MRSARMLVVSIASTLALAGCFLLPEGPAVEPTPTADVSERPQVDALVERLNEIDGIDAAIKTEIYEGSQRYPYSLSIEGSFAERDALHRAVVEAWQGFLAIELEGSGVAISVTSVPMGRFYLSGYFDGMPSITEDELDAELNAWFELRELVENPLSMNVTAIPLRTSGYSRAIWIEDSIASVDYAAVTAIPGVEGYSRQQFWAIGSFTSQSVMPPAETVALASQVEEALDGSVSKTRYDSGELPAGDPYLYVYAYLNDADIDDLGNSEEWPVLLTVVELLAEPTNPAFVRYLRVQPNVSSAERAVVTLGACPFEPIAIPRDTTMFELLSDVALPEGSAPGQCREM